MPRRAIAALLPLILAPAARGQLLEPPQASPPTAQAVPPVRVEPPEFDFGVADPQKVVEATFTLTNTGATPLVIREATSTCKCTVPELTTRVIPPGGSVPVKARLDIRGMLGQARKSANVVFEGYARPVVLNIRGTMSYAVQVSPSPIRPMGQRRLTIQCRSLDGTPFRVLRVGGRAPKVVAAEPSGVKPGERAVAQTLELDFTGESYPFVLLIETDHPAAPVVDVNIYDSEVSNRELPFVRNWREVGVDRQHASVGVIAAGGSAEFDQVVIRPDASKPLDLLVDSEDIRAEIVSRTPTEPGRERVIVKVTNLATSEKPLLASLRFRSNGLDARMWAVGVLRADAPAAPPGNPRPEPQ
ncbi:MAG: DUF1573 domain-containing protein [Phycisphaerales bacterium]|nr:DUF1573 domain-containing protein [Phycisphaerales bacterium]